MILKMIIKSLFTTPKCEKEANAKRYIKIAAMLPRVKGGSTYGQSGPKAPPLFEILKTCPSIISAPKIHFRFFLLQPTINT